MSEFKHQKLKLLVDSINHALRQHGVSRLFLVDNDFSWEALQPFIQGARLLGRWKLESPWQYPYEPFLSHIRCWYAGLDERQKRRWLHQVYPLHRAVLDNYLRGRITNTREPLVNEEYEYEQRRWHEELERLFFASLGAVQDEPLVFVIENANYLLPSGYALLKRISQHPANPKVFLLFYEPGFPGLEGFSMVESLVQESERRSFRMEVEIVPSLDESPEFLQPSLPDFATMAPIVRAGRVLAAAQDVLLLAKPYASLDLEEERELSERMLLNEIVLTYADSLNKVGDYRQAYLAANKVLKSVRDFQEGEIVVLAQLELGIAELRANAVDTAYYYAQMAYKLAQNLGNLRFELLAEMLMFHLRTAVNDTDLFLRVERRLREVGWENWSALIRSFGGYLAALYRKGVKTADEVMALIQEGIRLSSKLKNEMRLSTCFHAAGVFASLVGRIEEARRYYHKSLKIKRKLNNAHQLAKLLNSLGYLELLEGDFSSSQRYFAEALSTLRRTKVYVEVCGTLYNLGKVMLLLFRYREAGNYFEDMVRIMDRLGLQNLAFQPRVTILSLIGIASYQEGARINSWNALQKIQRLPSYQEQAKNNPYYWLLVLLLQSPERATEENINRILQNEQQEGRPFAVFFRIVIGDHLFPVRPALALRLWEEARKICEGSPGFTWLAAQLASRLGRGPVEIPPVRLRQVDFQVEEVLQDVDEEHNLNALERKIHEIDFISQFQNLVIINEKRQHLVENSHVLLSLHFAHDAAVIYLSRKEWYPYEIEVDLKEGEELYGLVVAEATEELKRRSASRGYPSVEVVRQRSRQEKVLCLLLFSKRSNFELTPDDRKVLQIFLGQFDAAMELIQTREALVLAAKTDKLTGLLNRLELERVLQAEYSRLRRYGDREHGAFSLLFIDMDNFKYYNDTFGHHIGDLILVEFARLLKEAVREVDSVGRLGGDEFVILLPETHKHQAAVVANRIFKLLEERHWFLPEISEALEREVSVPKERLISCSIGITEVSTGENLGVHEAMMRADQALYAAKRAGKARWVIH